MLNKVAINLYPRAAWKMWIVHITMQFEKGHFG